MRISRKAGIGLLGAAAVLAGGGIAVGAAGDDDYSATLAGKIDPNRPKNVILFVGDGMGDSEVTLGRYYGKGAAGRLNMDRLPFRGSSIHYVLRPGPGPNYLPELRRRLRAHGDRLVDRQAHAGRPPLAGPERRRQRPRLQPGLSHLHGDRPRPRQGDGQRLDRGDHRRHAGGPELAHLAARLPGPGRRAHDLPDGGQDRRRPGLDRRAAGRRGLRPLPRRRHAPATRRRSPPAAPTR